MTQNDRQADLELDLEINKDFEENSPYQEGIISEIYQRPDRSQIVDPPELIDLVNTERIVQKYLPKQTDIDKILKVIQRKVLKGTHLPITIKEIQAGYLNSPYFKDLYLYLSQNRMPSSKGAMCKIEILSERYILLDSLLFKLNIEKGKSSNGHTRGMCLSNNCFISFKFICRSPRSHQNIFDYIRQILYSRSHALFKILHQRLSHMSTF